MLRVLMVDCLSARDYPETFPCCQKVFGTQQTPEPADPRRVSSM